MGHNTSFGFPGSIGSAKVLSKKPVRTYTLNRPVISAMTAARLVTHWKISVHAP